MLVPLSSSSPLVLGSGSPRRREILGAIGVPFVVVAGDADETVRAGESAAAYLERVVLAKLASVRTRCGAGHGSAMLVADTSVVVDGAILGKPATDDEGLAMISRLQGRTHEVQTRFAIAAVDGGGPLRAETVVTRVTFRPMSEAESRGYVASGEGRDKAGGYAVQGLGMGMVARVEGSYTNVVGLPACEVLVALREIGLAREP
jgi:septum formation protein